MLALTAQWIGVDLPDWRVGFEPRRAFASSVALDRSFDREYDAAQRHGPPTVHPILALYHFRTRPGTVTCGLAG